MRTVVLGLGNPILHDDGAAFETLRLLEGQAPGDCDLKTAAVGGLRILDQICGYDRAIIVDAMLSGSPIGQVCRMKADSLRGNLHASCAHDLSLKEALELGQSLGMDLPQEIAVYGIEVGDPFTLHEGCSPEVLRGAADAAQRIAVELNF